MLEKFEFKVGAVDSGTRIDIFLAKNMPNLSRRKVRTLLDVGGCYVNNKRMKIASRTIEQGDVVRVEFHKENLSKAKRHVFELRDQDILFDQFGIIAINKPPGLPSQATRDQSIEHAEIALKKWLSLHKREVKSLILIHRLDKETSGVLLFATNNGIATELTNLFRERKIKKTYLALCSGRPRESSFSVNCFLSDIDQRTGHVVIVPKGGKTSFTDFEVLATHEHDPMCLIRCFPKTGRSHQIRVHLASKNLPILGDKRYFAGQSPSWLTEEETKVIGEHQQLHALEISFEVKVDDKMHNVSIKASLPLLCARVLESRFGPKIKAHDIL